MTRVSLLFVSTFAAIVIAFVPQPGPEASFHLPNIKTRSLSGEGLKPAKTRSIAGDACGISDKRDCRAATLGTVGPRG